MAHQTQPSHWRRQSTLIFSGTKFDGSLAPDTAQSGPLKPPPSPTTNNRNSSFGFWGGKASAPPTPTQAQGSGELSATSTESPSSPFGHRRKRSESTGGLKHTAGNISKIVKKSSSNFLKMFVNKQTFDDKDAPPTPVAPASASSSIRSFSVSSRPNTSELPPLAPPPFGHKNRIGPLDTPPPLSPLLGQDLEHHFSSMDPSLHEVDSQLQQQGLRESNVQSWLKSTNQGFPSKEYPVSFPESGESTPLDRRRPRAVDGLQDLDDDEVDDDDDENLSADIPNRLSKLYESGSIHPNQSQTSLYYSTKSSLSDTEGADSGSRRTSLAQDALGYSLGLSRGSSIRISQYSIGGLHLSSMPGSASTPSSPNKAPVEYMEARPTPRRPATMFIPLSSNVESGTFSEDIQKMDHLRAAGTTSEVTQAGSTKAVSPSTQLAPIVTREVSKAPVTRPVTICVSPQDATPSPASNFSSLVTPTVPTEDEREATEVLAFQCAKRCHDEDEGFLKRGEIAEYLGTPKPFNQLVLKHYMHYFDFAGKRLDVAFRVLCQKLVLKGETQEVDRILEVFAERYVICNPRSLLGGADHAKDVVHAITYSILLLNTDLHIVQQSSKMSKSAFLKNTLQAIQSQSQQASSDDASSIMTGSMSTLGLPLTITGESLYSSSSSFKKRPPSVKSWKSGQSQQSAIGQILSGHHHGHSSKMGTDAKANGGYGNGKWWQQELESLLKDMYSAVKQHQILLPTSSSTSLTPGLRSRGLLSSPPTSPTTSGFGSSLFSNRMSRLISSSSSPDPSNGNNGLFSGGRRNSVTARTRQLRSEAIQRLTAQAQTQLTDLDHPTFSNTPLPTSFNPLNVRHSVAGPLLSEAFLQDYNANRGIFRSGEDQSQHSSSSRLSSLTLATSHAASTVTTTPSASQNSLASLQTYGTSAPTSLEDCQALQKKQKEQLHQQHIQTRYRMEGILWRKHLLERTDKKAQHRAWRQLLVVVDPEQGTLSMFRSDKNLPKSSSTYRQQAQGSTTSLPTSMSLHLDCDADIPLFDEIPLQHTITNILPPPGYSSSRQHVFAVQLHTGAVYLFQTTSPKECEAWARTCNYWAARTSKEPLVGGVSNMEYGWGRALDLLAQQEEEQRLQAMRGLEGGRSTPASDMSQSSITTRSGASITAASSMTGPRVPVESSQTTDYLGEALGLGFNSTSSVASGGARTPSVRSGTRGSFSSASGVLPGSASASASSTSLGESISLFEWTTPMPTMTVSTVNEEDQMAALRKYVANLESDMESHQEHRLPMTRLFLPKTSNYVKAFNNWERRSRYLLKEMVKYQIYVECLEQSLQLQQQLQLELETAHREQLAAQYGDQRTEIDLEAELAKLIVHEGPI
ncbi:hypothetical protein B0O80DRAFT_449191 [Mortierella sp. GBAus27b]|nr:hypothetical protein B0O80DRAFT_449191 [Mortierella sp. GBAus27b]